MKAELQIQCSAEVCYNIVNAYHINDVWRHGISLFLQNTVEYCQTIHTLSQMGWYRTELFVLDKFLLGMCIASTYILNSGESKNTQEGHLNILTVYCLGFSESLSLN